MRQEVASTLVAEWSTVSQETSAGRPGMEYLGNTCKDTGAAAAALWLFLLVWLVL